MINYHDELNRLQEQIRTAATTTDAVSQLDSLLVRLRAIPPAVDSRRFVHLLSEIAGAYYFSTDQPARGIEAIALAVLIADQQGLRSELRRALSIQGLILSTTQSTPDALRSLLSALEIAEAMNDYSGIAAASVLLLIAVSDAATCRASMQTTS